MRDITIQGRDLQVIDRALQDLSANRMPFRVAVKIGRLSRYVKEYLEPWLEELRPFIEEHGEEGIIQGADNIQAFLNDARGLLEAEVTLEGLQPLSMSDLVSAPDFEVSPDSIEVLMHLGLLLE